MKIVLVSKEFPPSPRSYGIGTYTEELALSLAKLGHAATVICGADAVTPECDSYWRGIRVIRLPDEDQPATWLRTKLFASRAAANYRMLVASTLDSLITTGEAEIVEFPGFGGESYYWFRRRRIPMVVRFHGLTGWIGKSWRDRLSPRGAQLVRYEIDELLNADCVTIPSTYARKNLELRIPRQRICEIPNGINSSRWNETCLTAPSQDIQDNDILYVGTLSQRKGVFNLFEAAAALRDRGLWSGRLILYGRPAPEFARYRGRHWSRPGIPPAYIEARGVVSRYELAPLYRRALACCFPSWSDVFGYAAIEALASGGLVVGATGTGMAEFISHGQTGYLVPPRDSAALSGVLGSILCLSAVERQRICLAGQERVSSEFDQDLITERLVKLYGQQLHSFRSNIRA